MSLRIRTIPCRNNSLLFLSLNVQGGWKSKIAEINKWISSKKPTAILFQEVKLISDIDMTYHENDIPGYKIIFNLKSSEETALNYQKRKTKKYLTLYQNNPALLERPSSSLTAPKSQDEAVLLSQSVKNSLGKSHK